MKKRILFIGLLLITVRGFSQTVRREARISFESGVENIAGKEYGKAIADFDEAISLDSLFKQAYENRGVAKFYLNDYAGAISDYSQAIRLDPDEYSTYGRRGWAKFYLRDYDGAITDLDRAIEGSKDRERYLNFRGEAKFRKRDFIGAIEDFNMVISSWSADKEQKGKAYYWRGMIRIHSGDRLNGCTDLNKAVGKGNNDAMKAINEYCK